MASGAELAPKLNPLSVGETLDTAIRIYRGNAAKLWTAVAIVVVPLEIISGVVRYVGLPAGTFVQNGQLYAPYGSHISVIPGLVVQLLGALAQLLSIAAASRIVLDAMVGRTPNVAASFGMAARRLGGLLGALILGLLAIVIGLVLIVVPGIYLAVCFSVVVPVVVMEGRGGAGALGRSRELVKGRWWATFGRLVSVYVCAIILSVALGALTVLLTKSLSVGSVGPYVAISAALGALLSLLVSPFIIASITTIYVDLRVRKEAFDIELLSDAGSASQPAAAVGVAGLPQPAEPSAPFGS